MKKLAIALCLAITFAVPAMVMAQQTWTSSKIGSYNGYDYELWSQDNAGTTSMVLNGDNGTGANAKGGTFTATWSKTINVLFRSGRKFTNTSGQSVDGGGQGKTASAYGNISIDFAATWSSTDNVKMLGVYGWAFFASGSQPSNFSNQIEYYIIQDRGNYNAATGGTNSSKKGSATIDGIAYDFYVCDRIGQPMLTGNGNFKQYFSVPQSTNSHRTSGTISVSKHFEEWAKVGMKMDGPLYEVALKVESYTGSNSNASGNATITKNILTIGGTSTTPSSSSRIASSSSRAASSSSRIASSSSRIASSSSRAASSSSNAATGPQECGEYKTSFCGGLAYGSVPSNSTTMPTTGNCLYIGDFEAIQPNLNSTVAINGVENTCGSEWGEEEGKCLFNTKPATKDGGYYVYVKTGTLNSYQNNGWKGIVAKEKPACTPPVAEPSSSSGDGDTPILNNQLSILNSQVSYYSIKGEPLGNAKPQKAGVYIVKQGNSVKKIAVR